MSRKAKWTTKFQIISLCFPYSPTNAHFVDGVQCTGHRPGQSYARRNTCNGQYDCMDRTDESEEMCEFKKQNLRLNFETDKNENQANSILQDIFYNDDDESWRELEVCKNFSIPGSTEELISKLQYCDEVPGIGGFRFGNSSPCVEYDQWCDPLRGMYQKKNRTTILA